jgi:hypothetical protein
VESKPLPGCVTGTKETRLTFFQRRALDFIRSNPGCSASDLAEHLKPDSRMHTKLSNQGHGGCQGKAAWLWGGSVAGKLRKLGWVRVDYGASGSYSRAAYFLTDAGLDALKGRDR